MSKRKVTKMPIDSEFNYWLYKNHLEEWSKLWELSKEYETEQCNIADVVGRSEQLKAFIKVTYKSLKKAGLLDGSNTKRQKIY